MRRLVIAAGLALIALLANADSRDLLGDWDVTVVGMDIGTRPLFVILTFTEVDGRIEATVYDAPVLETRIDGNRFEVDVYWSSLFGQSHTSTLAGELTADDRLEGRVEHRDEEINMLGNNLRGGPLTGKRMQRHVVDEDAPPAPVDLSGLWRRANAAGRWKLRVNNYWATPQAQAVIDNYDEMDNPTTRCASNGLIMVTDYPYPLEIVATDEYLVLVYGADDARRIYLDGRDFPDDAVRSSLGFSTGVWQGDTLVVTTTRLTPAFLSHTGQPISGNAHTVEHFYLDDKGYLRADIWIHDPENYDRPPYLPRTYDRDFSPSVITQIGCDPYSYFRQLYLDGRLEEFWDRAKYRR